MKKKKFSESQTANILNGAEAGVALQERVRQHGLAMTLSISIGKTPKPEALQEHAQACNRGIRTKRTTRLPGIEFAS